MVTPAEIRTALIDWKPPASVSFEDEDGFSEESYMTPAAAVLDMLKFLCQSPNGNEIHKSLLAYSAMRDIASVPVYANTCYSGLQEKLQAVIVEHFRHGDPTGMRVPWFPHAEWLIDRVFARDVFKQGVGSLNHSLLGKLHTHDRNGQNICLRTFRFLCAESARWTQENAPECEFVFDADYFRGPGFRFALRSRLADYSPDFLRALTLVSDGITTREYFQLLCAEGLQAQWTKLHDFHILLAYGKESWDRRVSLPMYYSSLVREARAAGH